MSDMDISTIKPLAKNFKGPLKELILETPDILSREAYLALTSEWLKLSKTSKVKISEGVF